MSTNHNSPINSNPPIDDLALIEAFVHGLIQNESVLLSNPNLRVEPVFQTLQLLGREGLLATAILAEKNQPTTVRADSSYWELIHQALLRQSFFPIHTLEKDSFYTYEYRTVPEGYQAYYTSAQELWRVCWGRGSKSRPGVLTELLILSRGPTGRQETWQPVRNIESKQGALYIKMLGGEVAFFPEAKVVWLQRPNDSQGEDSKPEATRRVRPDLRGIYRRRL